MWLVCALLAFTAICPLGHSLHEEDRVSDLQLLLPIQYLNWKQTTKSKWGGARPGRPELLPDGPFSRIPNDQFQLDETSFLFDAAPKTTVKKDLSHPQPSKTNSPRHHSYGGLSSDLTERCFNYILQRDGRLSRRSMDALDVELLLNLCRHYVGTFYLDENNKQRARNEFHYKSPTTFKSGDGVSRGIGTGYQGYGKNVGSDGFITNDGGEIYATGSTSHNDFNFNKALALGEILNGLGASNLNFRNEDRNKNGGYTGNLGYLWGKTGTAGVNGEGSAVGNAAFNGWGGLTGNLGIDGNGGQTGNLGVGGNGGLFGNLGIGGQGGFFGNVGIGTAGGQFLDIYPGYPGNLLDYLFSVSPGYLSSKKNVWKVPNKYSLDYNSKPQTGKDVEFGSSGNSVSNEQTEPDSKKTVEFPNVLQTNGAKNQPVATNLEPVLAENAESEGSDGQEQVLDKDNAATPTKVTEDGKKVNERLVARKLEEGREARWLVRSLALWRAGRCPRCPRRRHVAPPATREVSSAPTPAEHLLDVIAQQGPVQRALEALRGSGRRDWMALDDHVDSKLRQYINSKRKWKKL